MKAAERWLFGYGSPVSLGVFRILMCAAILASQLVILYGYGDLFGVTGYLPPDPSYRWLGPVDGGLRMGDWSYHLPFLVPRLGLFDGLGEPWLRIAFLSSIAATFCALIGYRTRLACVLMTLGLVSLHHHSPLILNGGDTLMRVCAFYLAFASAGEACSVDRLIRVAKGDPEAPKRVSLWPQRLVQINLSLLYFTTVWEKWQGDLWRNGTATYYTAQLNEFKRFAHPAILESMPLVKLLTYGTLLTELALATLPFAPGFRRYVLPLGLLMHVYIDYTMNIPLFALAICSTYITFYEGEEITEWFQRLRTKRTAPARPGNLLDAADPLGLLPGQEAPSWKALLVNPALLFLPRLWLRQSSR